MKLPENLRDELKTPLGDLIQDIDVNNKNIQTKISPKSIIITVGDKTTENIINLGIRPQIQIIDGLEKRNQRDIPLDDKISTVLTCKNPPGEITQESIEIIQKAFSSDPPIRIIVDGEEDLLVIPVCILAPENLYVLYDRELLNL